MSGILDTITDAVKTTASSLGNTASEQLAALQEKAQSIKTQAQQMLNDRPKLESLMYGVQKTDPARAQMIKQHLLKGQSLQDRVTTLLAQIDNAVASLRQSIGLGDLGGAMLLTGLLATIAAVVYALYSYNKQSDAILNGRSTADIVGIYNARNGVASTDTKTQSEKDKQKYYLIGGAVGVLLLVYLLKIRAK